MGSMDYRDFDQEIWDRELDEFVPAVVFDMHTPLVRGTQGYGGRCEQTASLGN